MWNLLRVLNISFESIWFDSLVELMMPIVIVHTSVELCSDANNGHGKAPIESNIFEINLHYNCNDLRDFSQSQSS